MVEAKNSGRIGVGVGFIGGFAYGIIAEKFSTFVNNAASPGRCSTSNPYRDNTPRTTSNTKAPNSRLEKVEQRRITLSVANQSTLIKSLFILISSRLFPQKIQSNKVVVL